jgi:hypothetical protein
MNDFVDKNDNLIMESFGGNFDPESLIDDTDDVIHDHIAIIVSQKIRSLEEYSDSPKIPDITGIIESLRCALCLSVTATPVFIKHCLHFFCKECIEQ